MKVGKHGRIILVAIGLGIINTLVLDVFEYVGIDGTNWLWNDVVGADQSVWRTLLLAVVGGIVLTAACLATRNPRVPAEGGDLMADFAAGPPAPPALLGILLIGAVSLLAGASLGPEATLMATAAGLGALAAHKLGAAEQTKVLILTSVGALLVAFIGSLILLLLPILLLWKAARAAGQGPPYAAWAAAIAGGLAAYGTGRLLDALTSHGGAYGTMPDLPRVHLKSFVIAAVAGLLAAFIATALMKLTTVCERAATAVVARLGAAGPWVVGGVGGLLLGALYAVADNSVRFSGSLGTHALAQNASTFGLGALVGMIVAKVAVTALSKGTGYRGGLVFPAVYCGVAFGLSFGHVSSGFAGSGAVVGAVAGMLLGVVGSPVIGAIFLIALLPPPLWPLGLAALIGTFAASKLLGHVGRHVAS